MKLSAESDQTHLAWVQSVLTLSPGSLPARVLDRCLAVQPEDTPQRFRSAVRNRGSLTQAEQQRDRWLVADVLDPVVAALAGSPHLARTQHFVLLSVRVRDVRAPDHV